MVLFIQSVEDVGKLSVKVSQRTLKVAGVLTTELNM